MRISKLKRAGERRAVKKTESLPLFP